MGSARRRPHHKAERRVAAGSAAEIVGVVVPSFGKVFTQSNRLKHLIALILDDDSDDDEYIYMVIFELYVSL